MFFGPIVSDCIFCKIVAGEIPSQPVYDDEMVLAFKDLHPVAPTHVLIIPKKHVKDLAGAAGDGEAVLGWFETAAAKIAADAGITDFRVVSNNGRGAGQSVLHLHYHLLAGPRMAWPPG